VAIFPDGSLVTGTYDGYGRLNDHDQAVGFDTTVWHDDCWQAAGQPDRYQGTSPNAPDQGWFFDSGDHDTESPLAAAPAARTAEEASATTTAVPPALPAAPPDPPRIR
jgi:hypothetical protein